MRYVKLLLAIIFSGFLLITILEIAEAQESQSELKSVFVDLTKHDGWGPFSPREDFEAHHLTATFKLSGQEYKVYQLLHTKSEYEQRFIIQKADTEVSFSEKEGAPVYNKNEEITLSDTQFKIVGYSEKADQFVLIEKENVNYAYEGLKPDTEAPLFKYTGLDGQMLSLSEYKGQYVLLDFWGTWCGPCLKETPFLKKAYRQFSDQLEFIGIAVDYDKQRVEEYVQENNITWPQIFIKKNSTNPDLLIEDYNVFGYPAMFLIDPEGKIVIGPENETRLRGERLTETLEKILEDK